MMTRIQRRKITSTVALALSGGATIIGLVFLGAILWTLLSNGLSGVSLALFTENTPPPGSAGGLLNALYGSAVMTILGILDRRADRRAGGDVSRGIRAHLTAQRGDPVRERRAAQSRLPSSSACSSTRSWSWGWGISPRSPAQSRSASSRFR